MEVNHPNSKKKKLQSWGQTSMMIPTGTTYLWIKIQSLSQWQRSWVLSKVNSLIDLTVMSLLNRHKLKLLWSIRPKTGSRKMVLIWKSFSLCPEKSVWDLRLSFWLKISLLQLKKSKFVTYLKDMENLRELNSVLWTQLLLLSMATLFKQLLPPKCLHITR